MSPSVEWGVPTAVVRDDDGVVCSGKEGGTTVLLYIYIIGLAVVFKEIKFSVSPHVRY